MFEPGLHNVDCMSAMREYPDGYFDLAICDPPYGIGVNSMNYTRSGAIRPSRGSRATRRDYRRKGEWDVKPGKEFFTELFRVSKRQIIWGGNYFIDQLTPTKTFLVWDKRIYDHMSNDFADCELAWVSPGSGVARMFRFMWNGYLIADRTERSERFHPTQKPVALYEWCLKLFAKEGDKILDPMAGSGSCLIACHNKGFECTGFEIDEEYFQKATERINQESSQMNIFDPQFQQYQQKGLFDEC